MMDAQALREGWGGGVLLESMLWGCGPETGSFGEGCDTTILGRAVLGWGEGIKGPDFAPNEFSNLHPNIDSDLLHPK